MSSKVKDLGLTFALIAIATLLTFAGTASLGIWDPWELTRADEARTLTLGTTGSAAKASDAAQPSWTSALSDAFDTEKAKHPPLATLLPGAAFRILGVDEWTGRLPFALAGFATLLVLLGWLRKQGSVAAANWAVLVLATTPLFLVNTHQMMGNAVGAFGQTLLVASMALALSEAKRWPFVVAAVIGALLAIGASGVLLGLLPPLLAVLCATALARRPIRVLLSLGGATVIALAGVVVDFIRSPEGYSAWLGSAPVASPGSTSFEVVIEQVFHGFAPWSAVLVVAIAWALRPQPAAAAPEGPAGLVDTPESEEHPTPSPDPIDLPLLAVLWAFFGYAAHSLYASRFGHAAFLPTGALALLVALFVSRPKEHRDSSWTLAVVVSIFVGLIMRDFTVYPACPVAAVNASDVKLPESFHPKRAWEITLGIVFVLSFLGFIEAPDPTRPFLREPLELLRSAWRKSRVAKGWLIAFFAVLVGLLGFGGLCWVISIFHLEEQIPLVSLAIRIGKGLFFVPFALPFVAIGLRTASFLLAKFDNYRPALLAAAGLVFAGYYTFGFLPAIGTQLSPRDVYDRFNELHKAGEPLAEYKVNGRAAAYYAEEPVQEISSQTMLLSFLTDKPGRVWAVINGDELVAVNKAFRQKTNTHLFVADARSANAVLVTNQPIASIKNENFVATSVLDRVPTKIQHMVNANLEDKIELVGYDLDLPNKDYVGAGQSLKVTWYWRTLSNVGGNYKVFLHVDGAGNRLNGDHDPIDGKYPVRLWATGDVIVDTQELSIPPNYRPGTYTFFIGFYSGTDRLTVKSGPKDEDNRIRAGTLAIR